MVLLNICLCYKTNKIFFFFQAEDGIRASSVTGVQTCALPISRAGSRRSRASRPRARWFRHGPSARDRKSVVYGKSVDLGGRRIIKKKKIKRSTGWYGEEGTYRRKSSDIDQYDVL